MSANANQTNGLWNATITNPVSQGVSDPSASGGASIPPSSVNWFSSAVLAVPLSTLLHELGHYVIALALNVPGAQLHYSSVSYTALEQFWALIYAGNLASANVIHPLWKIAVISAGGPVVSLTLLWVSVLVTRLRKMYPLVIALGVVSSLRFVVPLLTGSILLLRWVANKQNTLQANTDEYRFALAAQVSPVVVLFFTVLAAGVGLYFLLITFPRQAWRSPVLMMSFGILLSLAIYMGFLGPWLLP